MIDFAALGLSDAALRSISIACIFLAFGAITYNVKLLLYVAILLSGWFLTWLFGGHHASHLVEFAISGWFVFAFLMLMGSTFYDKKQDVWTLFPFLSEGFVFLSFIALSFEAVTVQSHTLLIERVYLAQLALILPVWIVKMGERYLPEPTARIRLTATGIIHRVAQHVLGLGR